MGLVPGNGGHLTKGSENRQEAATETIGKMSSAQVPDGKPAMGRRSGGVVMLSLLREFP